MTRPIPMMSHLRFRWSFSPARRNDLKTAALIAAILAAYGITGTLDYHDALISEAQAHARRADLHRAQLLACINGGMPGLYSEDDNGIRTYVVCDRAFEVSDENTRKKS